MSNLTAYERLSHERKQLQKDGKAPSWLTTAGYQLLTSRNYLNVGETPIDMYKRIAERASELTTFEIPSDYGYSNWKDAFFDVMWRGWLSPSTPVLTNMGNDRGHPISCSGTYLGDSIRSWYVCRTELAQLTQRGYGVSTDLSPVRPRGSAISKGGKANGIMQPASGIVDDTNEVSQGASRRGSAGQYLDVLHADFDELVDQLLADDVGWNIGWIFTNEFLELAKKDPKRADTIWKKVMKVRMIKGKGYMLFLDKVNASRPKTYKDLDLFVSCSNLCAEIQLFMDENHSFTCVLSSMNIDKFEEWEDTKAVEIATVFLDAVISDMLIKAKQEEGFERIIRFTEKSRAIGLGQLGQSTYFQRKGWVYGDMQSTMFNSTIVKILDARTLAASKLLAEVVGEPEWLKDYGERFTHRLAFPPTKSTAEIVGGISEGCEPVFANVFESDTAGGTVYRINPVLLDLMKERGVYNETTMKRIAEDQGSVQAEDWLSQHEKDVFRTAFELNQENILRMASDRQKWMNRGGGGQGQSTNLYFQADAKEEEISRLHFLAMTDEHLESLYYVRTLNGAMKVKVEASSCESCEG